MQRASQNTQNMKQRGFTLIEALITAIVMAVGLLGLAGLQIAGMKSNHSAYLRSQATIASYDLIDRMRANPAAYVGRRFDTAADSGNAEFEAWEEVIDHVLPAPEVAEDASAAKGVVDCTAIPATDQDDCTTGNVCGAGNCAICVRWSDARGERRVDTEPPEEEHRNSAALEFHVCSRLAEFHP